MLTFSDEVEYIWRHKFTGATILFCLNRYAPLLYATLFIIGLLPVWHMRSEVSADMVSLSSSYLHSTNLTVLQA